MFRRLLRLSDLRRGEMIGCPVDGKRVLLVRTDDGSVRAYEDRCVHLGVPLSEGVFESGVITCHAHHYQYDADTGNGVNPRRVCLKPFAVKLESDGILVDISQAAPGGAE